MTPTNDLDARRTEAVEETVMKIKQILRKDSSAAGLARAADELAALARQRQLFTFDAFPLPKDGGADITYRVRQDADGSFAFYLNAGLGGHSFRPHDHGESWGIVAAVDGCELHKIYDRTDDGRSDENACLKLRDEINLAPGTAVALPVGAIHSVHTSEESILHIHMYAKGFHVQEGRTEYDLESGSAFYMKNKGVLDVDIFSMG